MDKHVHLSIVIHYNNNLLFGLPEFYNTTLIVQTNTSLFLCFCGISMFYRCPSDFQKHWLAKSFRFPCSNPIKQIQKTLMFNGLPPPGMINKPTIINPTSALLAYPCQIKAKWKQNESTRVLSLCQMAWRFYKLRFRVLTTPPKYVCFFFKEGLLMRCYH